MNMEKLENNIIDSIEEQQLKLGYLKETVRLYYPLSSLNRFLDIDCGIKEMESILQEFSRETKKKLGGITITKKGERFCIAVQTSGAEYIHQNLNKSGFLARLIQVVGKHGSTLEEVLEVFYQFSDQVRVKQMVNGEFDYLVYFDNHQPDDYRYCISVEAEHIIYHRYTPEDYEDFGF